MYVVTLLCFIIIIIDARLLVAVPLRFDSSDELQSAVSEVDAIIKGLARNVSNAQYKADAVLVPGISWHHWKGTYPHAAIMNMAGSIDSNFIRTKLAIPDDGVYITELLSNYLLDISAAVVDYDVCSEDQLIASVNALERFKDRNRPGTSALSYWPQALNITSGLWYSSPGNAAVLFPAAKRILGYFNNLLDLSDIKLSPNHQALVNLTKLLDLFIKFPPNFDDAFVYLGMGSALSKTKFKDAYNLWFQKNPNIKSLMKLLSKYAYRPFSSDINSNLIAPSSFYVLRELLWEMKEQHRTDFAIPLEYLFNYNDTHGDRLQTSTVLMLSNNMEIAMNANVMYGITAAILNNIQSPEDWFDDDIQGIYRDIADMEAFLISHNFSGRPDIAFFTYPQPLQFMWFLSRTLHLLTSASKLPFVVMEVARDVLTTVMRTDGTEYIMQWSHKDWDGLTYFDGFLGNGDINLLGLPIQRHQDRIFLTATAVNALTNIWTEGGTFNSSTPNDVKLTISLASQWLIKHFYSGVFEPRSAYTGAFGLSYADKWWTFPSNHNSWLNGTNVASDFVLRDIADLVNLRLGVEGVIDKADYEKMLQESFLGSEVFPDFHGNNSPKDRYFLFWESESVTNSAVMLALTNYRRYFLH